MKTSWWKHYFNFAHHLEIGNRNKKGSIWEYCQGRIGNISRLAFDLLLLLFWSASQLISLIFRRHQRTCYSLYPLLKHIEPLFVRKVKKIPLWAIRWSQSLLAILSSAHLFVTIRRSNTYTLRDFEGEGSSYERGVFAYWTRSSLVCDPDEGQQRKGSWKTVFRSPHRSLFTLDANAAENW